MSGVISSNLIIELQSVERDELRYPNSSSAVVTHRYKRLSPSTRVEDIKYFSEIRVPFENENVVAVLSFDVFEALVRNITISDPEAFLRGLSKIR